MTGEPNPWPMLAGWLVGIGVAAGGLLWLSNTVEPGVVRIIDIPLFTVPAVGIPALFCALVAVVVVEVLTSPVGTQLDPYINDDKEQQR